MDLKQKLVKNSLLIDQKVEKILNGREQTLASMRYSAIGGGKKLRSFIFLDILENLGAAPKDYIDIAVAIELLHVYSLAHDDLPAMDDAKLRRGKKTLHLQFDEATAILAGDALLTIAFEIIAKQQNIDSDIRCSLIHELSIAAGYRGMIEGQLRDISSQNKEMDLDSLKQIYNLKTGKLFRFCAIAPCIITGQLNKIALLENFALHFGMLFQITDDILDYSGSSSKTGKDASKDQELNKLNYVTLAGMKQTQADCTIHSEKSLKVLEKIAAKSNSLQELVLFAANRKN